jgi:HK97 family phage major capsid protein
MFAQRLLTAHRENLRQLDSQTRELTVADYGEYLAHAFHLQPMAEPRKAGSLRRVADELAEQHRKAGRVQRGNLVPLNVLARGLTVGTPSAGGNLAPNITDQTLVESLRPFAGVIGAGAQVLTGVRAQSLSMPRIDTGVGVAWIDEDEAVGDADPTFDRVLIRPRTVAATVAFSRNLAKSASMGDRLSEVLGSELIRAIVHEIDRVALAGSGTGQEPTGILHADGVLDVAAGADGAAPDLDLLVDMEEAIGTASGLTPSALFTTPQARRTLRKTARTGSDSAPLWSDENRVLGYPAYATAHLPADGTKGTGSDLSSIILGDFRQLAIVFFGATAADIIVNPYTNAASGLIRVTALLEVGIGLRHAPAFARCRDVVTESE